MKKVRKKNLALQISTVIVVSACFVVMGGALLLSQNLQKILTLWGEDIQMTVYLSEDISETEQTNVENILKSSSEVRQVQRISQEKALTDFRQQLATYAPDLAEDDELLKLIPASLQVSLSDKTGSADKLSILESIAAQLRQQVGVDEVSYGQDWVEKYSALTAAFRFGMQGMGLVIILASVFVMSNVIRASVEARREEISVMELVGATSTMIRRPFLRDGALVGGLSSSIALIICFGLFLLAKRLFVEQLSFLQLSHHLSFLSPLASLFFVLGGVSLGAFASYLCVRRINDGWAARGGW